MPLYTDEGYQYKVYSKNETKLPNDLIIFFLFICVVLFTRLFL